MDVWIRAVFIVLSTLVGGTGFWAYLRTRDVQKNATTRLMMGFAYHQIITQGPFYINRGYVTPDEYEDLRKYFFDPYKALGGNGTAENIMIKVSQLPFGPVNQNAGMVNSPSSNGRFVSNVPVVANTHQQAPSE